MASVASGRDAKPWLCRRRGEVQNKKGLRREMNSRFILHALHG
jgi:hypothetical protein